MLHFKTKYFAHRGLHGDRSTAPENSMEAFRRAVAAGFGIELDIQFSRDGRIVVFHDDTLLRVCGACGRVCDYTYAELLTFPLYNSDQRIPLFEEVLALVDGKVPLIIELKAAGRKYDPKLAEEAAIMLDHYAGEFCVESFHPLYVYWFRRHRPAFRRGQLCTDFFKTHAYGNRLQFLAVESQITNFFTKPDFVAFDIRFRKHHAFRFWRKFCTPVGWTLRGPEEIEELSRDFDYFIAERVRSSD